MYINTMCMRTKQSNKSKQMKTNDSIQHITNENPKGNNPQNKRKLTKNNNNKLNPISLSKQFAT